jgi:hypothetical protein
MAELILGAVGLITTPILYLVGFGPLGPIAGESTASLALILGC